MKYVLSFVSIIGIIVILLCCCGNTQSDVEYLRIHIRANSNSIEDQSVKYKVKDAIVEALIPVLSEVHSKDEAIQTLTQNFQLIQNVANEVLKDEGFSYKSSTRIDNEYFPTRTYEDLTLEEGYYDALIVDLGSGEGNNWWCVVFPAFCFTETKNFDNIVYISRIWEILKSVIQK